MLTVFEELPEGLYSCRAADLHGILPGPSLFHLPGRRREPLFVSVLLHGNEDTGWQAAQSILRKYRQRTLPRALSLFVGNVAAARAGVRRLPGQCDYNRVWPGCEDGGTPEHAMAERIVAAMRTRGVYASIDVHNNTGLNPHYACVNRTDPHFLHLAHLFSRIVVYFQRPRGVQSMAFARLCPAVTVECGKPGSLRSDEHAAEFIDACLHLAAHPSGQVPAHDLDLFQTVATVRVAEGRDFGFGDQGGDIRFERDLDHMNFREVPQGVVWARLGDDRLPPLRVIDDDGRDVYHDYFGVEAGVLTLRKSMMPAMLSCDVEAVRQDCLCYLMQRLPQPE